MNGKIIHEYRRDKRHANVLISTEGLYVELYENNQMVRVQEAYEHSESWAEDIAENWVDGLLNGDANE